MLASNGPNIPPSTIVSTTPMQPRTDADDISQTVTPSPSSTHPNDFAICSPSLPWEVIERVIGHCGDDPESLHNFSLTCRDLRPRALCLLVADVRFKCRDDIFDFCDFVKANPHLKPLVRSIAVRPEDFAPFPLLSILPNLSKVVFTRILGTISMWPVIILNQSTLKCSRLFGIHIQALHFYQITFRTYLDFARVLLTFPNLTELVCDDVDIQSEGSQAALTVLKQRMSERLHLHTVSLTENDSDPIEEESPPTPAVAVLLLDSGLLQSTVKALTVTPYRSYSLSHTFAWPQLQALVLVSQFTASDLTSAIVLLKEFPSSTLQDVTVKFQFVNIFQVILTLDGKAGPRQCKELDQTLMRFSKAQGMWKLYGLYANAKLFLIPKLREHFPELSNRKALIVTEQEADPRAGHNASVEDLAVSPNGKWVATASWDCLIILWGSYNGAIIHQWAANSYKPINSLAFSPDGQYLASSGYDHKIKVWDLAEGFHNIATLEGHTSPVICCVWSPCGDMIGSIANDQTIRLWDTHSYHQIYILECAFQDIYVKFSPDSHWLTYGSHHTHFLWNIHSKTLHKSFQTSNTTFSYASVDPSSSRLLVAEEDMVKVTDINTGEELAVLAPLDNLRDTAFSPDGALVVTGSEDGMVNLWDAYSGAELFALAAHNHAVYRVCFSPCGEYVASGSRDGTVRLWRTRDGSSIATLTEQERSWVRHVAFSIDGETLWSGDNSGRVTMRRMRDIVKKEEPSGTPLSSSTRPIDYDTDEPGCADGDPGRSYEGCEDRGDSGWQRELGNSHAPGAPAVKQENMEGSESSMASDKHEMVAVCSRSRDSTATTPAVIPILIYDTSTQMNSRGTISTGTSVEGEATAVLEQLPCSEEPHPKAQENVYSAERAQAMPSDADLGNTADLRVSALDESTSLLYHITDEPGQRPEVVGCGSRSHRPFQTPTEEGRERTVAGDEDGRLVPSSSSRKSMAMAVIPITPVAVDVPARTRLEGAALSGADVELGAEAFLGQSHTPEEPRRKARENIDSAGEPAQATSVGTEPEHAGHSDVSMTMSPMHLAMNAPERVAEEHERRLGGSVGHVYAGRPQVSQGSSGGWRELVPKALKTIAKRARRAARQVASGAKTVREKCAKFGTKLVKRRRQDHRSATALS